jgi:hypothetical protein
MLLTNLQVLVGKYGGTIQNRLMGTPRDKEKIGGGGGEDRQLLREWNSLACLIRRRRDGVLRDGASSGGRRRFQLQGSSRVGVVSVKDGPG